MLLYHTKCKILKKQLSHSMPQVGKVTIVIKPPNHPLMLSKMHYKIMTGTEPRSDRINCNRWWKNRGLPGT